MLLLLGTQFINDLTYRIENIIDFTYAINVLLFVLLFVITHQLRCLGFKNPQAITDGFFIIICTVMQGSSTFITQAIQFWW